MQQTLAVRIVALGGCCAALPALLACLDHPIKPVELKGRQEDEASVEVTINKDVDILFVIDDSGSMGEEQLRLSRNFGAFIDVLEDEEVDANYRIAITTTDAGNPVCAGGGVSSPENGQFVFSSCHERLSDFSNRNVNAENACTEFCPADTWASIEVKETAIDGSEERKARPWIERIDGATNLPDGLTSTQAMRCLAPQGVSGCGFESHLESMWKALKNSEDPTQNEFGFIRDNALLSVVFLTDEADCSINRSLDRTVLEGVFGSADNRVFWDPAATAEDGPLSSICWNAGVRCDGEDCASVDYDAAKAEVSPERAEDQAVLEPVSKYINALTDYEERKQRDVLVAAIAGVPTTYPDVEIPYQTPADEQTRKTYGIAPGCSVAGDSSELLEAEAVPPVRLKEFADAFLEGSDDTTNLFSICADDYAPALEAVANAIRDQIRPPCMTACVADTDPLQEGVQPTCTLTQTVDDVKENIVPCNNGSIPEGTTVCFEELTDREQTGDPSDDMSDACVEPGWNLEFRLLREGSAPSGASVDANCQLSPNRERDCPRLP